MEHNDGQSDSGKRVKVIKPSANLKGQKRKKTGSEEKQIVAVGVDADNKKEIEQQQKKIATERADQLVAEAKQINAEREKLVSRKRELQAKIKKVMVKFYK